MVLKIKHLKRDFNKSSLLIVIISLLLAIPVFAILISLFKGTGEMWEHITSYFLIDYIQNSIILLLGSGIICFVIGTSSAWVVSRYKFKGRKIIEWLLFMPLAIPSYIAAYSYVGLFGYGGSFIKFINYLGFNNIDNIEMMNIYGLVWVLSFSLYPYVYASTRLIFQSYPTRLKDTASLLGASKNKYFFKIALPLASPAIIGGLFLVFMEVLNDYGAAKYYGINTFTTGIFRTWTALEDLQSSIYLSAILVVLVFVLVLIVKWLRGRRSYNLKTYNSNDQDEIYKKDLKGLKKIIFLTIVFVPILFGFLFPFLQLIIWGIQTFESMFNSDLLNIGIQTLFLGISTSIIVVFLATSLIYLSKWNYLKQLNVTSKLATLGYVIPGAIIGIGVIKSSHSITEYFSTYHNIKIGYIIYNSILVLIYAYVFRFIAVAFNSIESNTLKLSKSLSESSNLLGFGKIKTFFKIDFPLIKNALFTSFILVFIDVIKELPLTLILKPYNLSTLAIKAYEYAEDERVAEAALPALFLIFIIGSMISVVNYRFKLNKS
ncbi:iron ABC transporter permease [Flavobacteriales bacterium]|nr:iron ABC transporter permease [Flavobacteriales bacterium]